MASSPFSVVGKLAVVDSATAVCARNTGAGRRVLHVDRFKNTETRGGFSSVQTIFGDQAELDFCSGWEVLMGQNECVNWVRSTGPDQLKLMRYPGEYKFAGGNVEAGESVVDAAARELEEEFLRPTGQKIPRDAVFRPFVVKQTLPVQSKSNIMWNTVALAEENPWLRDLNIEAANAGLEARRRHFAEALRTGDFWRLSQVDREAIAPEVRELRWIPLVDAVFLSLSTMVAHGAAHYVNTWQELEFRRLGIRRRDPMFMTACILIELESFPGVKSLASYCAEKMGSDAAMRAERERMQWLFPGMTDADVKSGGRGGLGEPEDAIPNVRTVMLLRAQRLAGAPMGLPARL